MQISDMKRLTLAAMLLVAIGLQSCKKDLAVDQFEVNQVRLYPSIAAKDKMKSQEQYVSILHTNLSNKPCQEMNWCK